MPPRSKKAYGEEHQQKDVNPNETRKRSSQNKENKENICLRLRKRKKNYEEDNLKLKIKLEDSDEEFEKMLLSFQKQKVYSKPLTFWERKIKNLESQNNLKKKCELYEFSGTDDSASLCKRTKKPKRKCGMLKKKQNAKSNAIKFSKKAPESKIKAKENCKQSFIREQAKLSEKKEKLGNEKLTFSSELPFFGVTSTPAKHSVNLVSASDFMFLSPVLKKIDERCIIKNNKCRLDSKMILDSESKTCKRKKNLQGANVRVLRSKTITVKIS